MGTDTASTTVRRLKPDDVTTAAGLFAHAFSDDPLNLLLIPDADERRRAHARLVRPRLVRALRYGHVFCATRAESMCGLAVWAPPNVRLNARPPLKLLPSTLRGASRFAPGLPRLTRSMLSEPELILRQSAVRRRAIALARDGGAWHLAGLAVAPEYQGQGIARALLDPMLARADLDGTGVWLETNYPTNVPLYQRFGFTVTSHLPGRGAMPDWWLMQRLPDPPASTPPLDEKVPEQ
jgi:ribosomal protein S18 acetylase RimI-like enzyme